MYTRRNTVFDDLDAEGTKKSHMQLAVMHDPAPKNSSTIIGDRYTREVQKSSHISNFNGEMLTGGTSVSFY